MISIIKKNKKGFTLIELVLYASLVSLLVLGVSSFWSIVKQFNLKNKSMTAVEDQGAFVADFISEHIRNAGEVCLPLTSGISGRGAVLIIDDNCSPNTSAQTRFAVSNGILSVKEGSSSPVETNLTDSRVYVSNLDFVKAKDPSGGPSSVNYSFVIQSKSYSNTTAYSYQKTFSGGATLRVQ
ncbi:prepilin-type N-terminal cleavage/methylation domain-containing protein [Candidatus Nomurabacteria bacterium]|nr:prepilin-type N-terminal cleavage/methylation domain-containing protein [Candidatus Nomurabacteria bacterium]